MSLLDRLIGRAVARLPSRRGPSLAGVDADGLLIADGRSAADGAGEHRRGWAEVDRVVAASAAGLVGETALLALAFADGAGLTVPETDARWDALVEAVDLLPGAVPATRWRLRLIAEPDQPVEVYRQG